VSVATADLPESVRGQWLAEDGTVLEVQDFYIGKVGGEVAPKAATAVWRDASGRRVRAHITSFDGRVVMGEEYLGGETVRRSRSPRRFYRLLAEDDRLDVEALRLDLLVADGAASDVTLVDFEGIQAVAYTDVRAMAATLRGLEMRADAWVHVATFESD
jgi:hypothetical protein